jgi:hypothetical protein
MMEGSGSGPMTSGSGRPKYIRIWNHSTAFKTELLIMMFLMISAFKLGPDPVHVKIVEYFDQYRRTKIL